MTRRDEGAGELDVAARLDAHGFTAAAHAVVRHRQDLQLGDEEQQAVTDTLPDTTGSPDLYLMGRALSDALPHGDELTELLTLTLDGRALFTDRRGLQAALTLDIPPPPRARLRHPNSPPGGAPSAPPAPGCGRAPPADQRPRPADQSLERCRQPVP